MDVLTRWVKHRKRFHCVKVLTDAVVANLKLTPLSDDRVYVHEWHVKKGVFVSFPWAVLRSQVLPAKPPRKKRSYKATTSKHATGSVEVSEEEEDEEENEGEEEVDVVRPTPTRTLVRACHVVPVKPPCAAPGAGNEGKEAGEEAQGSRACCGSWRSARKHTVHKRRVRRSEHLMAPRRPLPRLTRRRRRRRRRRPRHPISSVGMGRRAVPLTLMPFGGSMALALTW